MCITVSANDFPYLFDVLSEKEIKALCEACDNDFDTLYQWKIIVIN